MSESAIDSQPRSLRECPQTRTSPASTTVCQGRMGWRCDHAERVPHGRLRPPIAPIRLGSAITTFCSTALERELLSSLYYYWIPIKSIQQELCLSERNVRTLLSFSCQAKSAITAKGAKSGCSATRKPAVLYATCGPAQQPAVLSAQLVHEWQRKREATGALANNN